MTIPLLHTKLNAPPLPGGIVRQERLLDQLNLGLAQEHAPIMCATRPAPRRATS